MKYYFSYLIIKNLTKANIVLQEEFKSELLKQQELYAAKESLLKTELENLKGIDSSVDMLQNFTKNVSNDSGKEKNEENNLKDFNKDSAKFLRKELEECKKRNTDIMKENSVLRNQIIGLTGQNEKLSKNTINLTRRVDDLSTKLKKTVEINTPIIPVKPQMPISITPKLVSLKEQRLQKKTKLSQRTSLTRGINEKLDKKSESEDLGSIPNKQIEEIKDDASIVTTAVSEEIKLDNEKIANNYKSANSLSRASNVGLKTNTAKLVMCKPSSNKSTRSKYAIATEDLIPKPDNKRPMTAADAVRSKSPVDYRTEDNFAFFQRGVKERSNTINTPDKPKVAGRDSLTPITIAPYNESQQQQNNHETSKWKCVHSEEYHSLGVLSIAAYEHYLISSSNVIKMWDINKKSTISELPVPNAKILYPLPDFKMLISATEQHGTVTFYSLPSLEIIQTIETGMDAVRAINIEKNIVFIGGCGSVGALQLWDLNTFTKLCEKEKNSDKDIFSVLCKNSVIYYGGRNRCINRINFDNLVSLKCCNKNIGKYSCTESNTLWSCKCPYKYR